MASPDLMIIQNGSVEHSCSDIQEIEKQFQVDSSHAEKTFCS